MVKMFNRVIMVGRLARDPEVKMDRNGAPFTIFTIAVDMDFPKETNFFDCLAFKNSGAFVERYLRKGRLVLVEGSLTINKWISEKGEEKQKPQILVNRVLALESKKEVNGQEGFNQNKVEKVIKSNKKEEEELNWDDDKLFEDLLGDSDDSPLK